MSLCAAPQRTRHSTLRRRVVLVLLLAAGMLGVSSAAYAYWTSHGAGSGSASNGTLAPPTAVLATSVSGSTTVSVSWTASTGSPVPQGYYVVRTRLSDSTTAPACGTSPTSLRTTTSCSDTSVPDGDFSYAATAVYSSWTATSTSSAPVHVGAAAKLAFTTQPGGGSWGVAWSTQPVVTVQEASGATVTGSAAAVQLTLTTVNGGPGVLTCTSNPRNATAGVATFSGCSVNTPGTYRLTASSGTLTTALSSTFTVTARAASKLAFSTQPSASSASQVAFAQQPVVTVQDSAGNTVTADTSSVSLALTTPGGATLACTTNPKQAVAGVVTFGGCKVDKVGTYTLTASDGSLTATTSSQLTVTVGAASKLVFSTQPSLSSASQTAFAQQPAVTVQDAGGNTVTTDTSSVTLTLTTPAGATLACTNNPKPAVAGVVTFGGCKVDKAGTYTLTATDGSLTTAVSTSVLINGPTVSSLTLANGGMANKADKGDTVTIQFSSQLNASSVCSTWTNSGTQSVSVTATITDSGSNDVLTVTSTQCTLTVGQIALGGNYVNAGTPVSFGNTGNMSSVALDTSGKLVITLGQGTAPNSVSTNVVPAYTPASGITDLSGNSVPATAFTGTSSRF